MKDNMNINLLMNQHRSKNLPPIYMIYLNNSFLNNKINNNIINNNNNNNNNNNISKILSMLMRMGLILREQNHTHSLTNRNKRLALERIKMLSIKIPTLLSKINKQ